MFCENVDVIATQQLNDELSTVLLRVYESDTDDRRGSATDPCKTIDFCSSSPDPTSSSTRPRSVWIRVSALLVRPSAVIRFAGTNTPRPPSMVKKGDCTIFLSKY